MMLDVKKLDEAGYKPAMYGLSLNKNKNPSAMKEVAIKLAPLDYGHNKFMESIIIWASVKAPRYWWQDADTYRISTKQSQSTNHTILKRQLFKEDFEDENISTAYLEELNNLIVANDFLKLKQKLPEGFLQIREWCFSYKTFANIVRQRYKHKLPQWKKFIVDLYEQLCHPEFINLPEISRSV